MLLEARRLVERAARWLVRSHPTGAIDTGALTERFAPAAGLLREALPDVLQGRDRDAFAERLVELRHAGVPGDLAHRVASMQALLSVFDIVQDTDATGAPQQLVTETYFGIGARLGLDWMRDRILELPRGDRWQALARAALRDDLYLLHRSLTRDVLATGAAGAGAGAGAGAAAIDAWLARNAPAVERCQSVLADVQASQTYDTTTLPVALRELKGLVADV
jgi:glutamate dehydrogenase